MRKPHWAKWLLSFFIISLSSFSAAAQMITGVWKGKMNGQKVEIKIIQKGDSLTGTSYYFESANNYRRYTIRGYFDQQTNEAIWWDDQLIAEKSTRFSLLKPGKIPLLANADFNCPGSGRMMLDGKVADKASHKTKGNVHLDKIPATDFSDEWDFVIDNYTIGANDPVLIDSINQIAFTKPITKPEPAIRKSPPASGDNTVTIHSDKTLPSQKAKPTTISSAPAVPLAVSPTALSIQEKYTRRTKRFIKEIPISGDSIELRFYDNAEIDGDSISLFLNDQLIFQHIRLAAQPYVIKLSLANLKDVNELTMVAENLGAIPPNTSYMIAIVNEQRFDAYLASNEGESAMIRFKKIKP